MFSEDKVTHMAAYFLLKSDRRMSYLKLLKLLYLAERQAFSRWGESMSGDKFVSMPHGPVMSSTYELIKGNGSDENAWQNFINDEANYELSLKNEIEDEDLDELSRADCKIMDEIYESYGHMHRFEIRDFTHDHCTEWEDPQGSSYPIKPESILRALGKNEDQVRALIERNQEQAALDRIKEVLR